MPDPTQPFIGIQAILDDTDFQQKLRTFLRSVHDMEDVVDKLAHASETADEKRKKSAETSSSAIVKAIRQLRWEMMTLLFFMRIARRMWDAAWTAMGDAVEKGSERMGIRALARRLETDLGDTAAQIRELADGAISVQDSMQVVLQGLLTDQGQFSEEYGRLWEAARVAAVTGMADADDAFQAFLTSLVEGTGAATDAISPIYGVQRALEDYAYASGRTVEELSAQETAHITLQRIYQETDLLLSEGAASALEYAEAWNRVQARLSELKEVAGMYASDTGFLALIDKFATAAAKSLAVLGATVATVRESIAESTEYTGTTFWGELLGAIRGEPSEAFSRHMQKYADALGYFRDEVDKSKLDYESMRLLPIEEEDLSPIVDHLMKREKLVEDHMYRVEQIEDRYQDRLASIESRYNKNVARIQRNAQRQRDRAIRNYNRRREQQQREHWDRLAKLEEQYNLRQEQNRREYHLRDLQTEAMYLYERGRMVAYGDVLAIEDLDARYQLEREAREQNYQEQQRQERENYELQRKWVREQMDQQMADLRQALEDQLAEINAIEMERLAEEAERRKEDMAEAEKARRQELEAEERQHQRSLDQWNQYWVKLADRFKLGLNEIRAIMNQFFGQGGDVDSIMSTFISRWDQYMNYLRQLQQLMAAMRRGAAAPLPGDYGYGRGGGSYLPRQYGGSGIYSRPTNLRVGEGYQPEMVSVKPLSSIAQVKLSWEGGAIPVAGTGLGGADVTGIGDAIAQGLLIALQKQVIRTGATYG